MSGKLCLLLDLAEEGRTKPVEVWVLEDKVSGD
jgi:hypothetical protein